MEPNEKGQENPSPGNAETSAAPDFAGLASAIATSAGATVPAGASSPTAPKRGPGRPPKHGAYAKSNGSNGKSPVTLPPTPPLPFPAPGPAPTGTAPGEGVDPSGVPRLVRLPPALVARLAKIPWSKLDKLAKQWLRSQALGIPETLRAEVDALIEATGFSPDELEMLCEITPLVLEEWQIGGGEWFTPTTALAILIAFKAMAVFAACRTLQRLAESQNVRGN